MKLSLPQTKLDDSSMMMTWQQKALVRDWSCWHTCNCSWLSYLSRRIATLGQPSPPSLYLDGQRKYKNRSLPNRVSDVKIKITRPRWMLRRSAMSGRTDCMDCMDHWAGWSIEHLMDGANNYSETRNSLASHLNIPFELPGEYQHQVSLANLLNTPVH